MFSGSGATKRRSDAPCGMRVDGSVSDYKNGKRSDASWGIWDSWEC